MSGEMKRTPSTPRSGSDGIMQGIFGVVVAVGFFWVLESIMRIESSGHTVSSGVQTLLGFLGGAFVSVVGYYFGSSLGSKSKDKVIEKK
ncbi:hypothetical protein [Desulfovibrio inopinatus]|uniref:hypothetical protein n=1 Tax=Desulfovibrio inopinatus TaxID=102109 RepID=UPI00042471C6|nr:hypothetical protein [Desulfovibrio inopinatus]